MPIAYHHVDVFSRRPFGGNSLAVFPDALSLSAGQMAGVTRELRHFESIFLGPVAGGAVRARVFDLDGELDFAGHPLLGAACVLHRLHGGAAPSRWAFSLPARDVAVAAEPRGGHFSAALDQGRADFLGTLPGGRRAEVAAALSLGQGDLRDDLPLEVASTGLRYLVVPLRRGLERVRIARDDFGEYLAGLGAQFAYVVDVDAREGRHFNNDGRVEDVATGSGAGVVAAYLVKHGVWQSGERVTLRQGRFVGRPSELSLSARSAGGDIVSVEVGGDVAFVGRGELDALPGHGA